MQKRTHFSVWYVVRHIPKNPDTKGENLCYAISRICLNNFQRTDPAKYLKIEFHYIMDPLFSNIIKGNRYINLPSLSELFGQLYSFVKPSKTLRDGVGDWICLLTSGNNLEKYSLCLFCRNVSSATNNYNVWHNLNSHF